MVQTTNGFITPAALTFNLGQLTTKAPTATNSIEHIALRRTLVVTRCVVIQLDESFKDADTLILPAIHEKPLLQPIRIVQRHIATHLEEHLN